MNRVEGHRIIERSPAVSRFGGGATLISGVFLEGLTFFNSELAPTVKDKVLMGIAGIAALGLSKWFFNRAKNLGNSSSVAAEDSKF